MGCHWRRCQKLLIPSTARVLLRRYAISVEPPVVHLEKRSPEFIRHKRLSDITNTPKFLNLVPNALLCSCNTPILQPRDY
jgi:hypothetical protein